MRGWSRLASDQQTNNAYAVDMVHIGRTPSLIAQSPTHSIEVPLFAELAENDLRKWDQIPLGKSFAG
jgi:hypothetical protein